MYPRLYLHTDPAATIVAAARAANDGMPDYACGLLEAALGGSLEGLTVVVLGASYRGGVKETAVSGVFPVVHSLAARGAQALVHDPMHSDAELLRLGLVPYAQGIRVDAAVLQADHEEYRDWTSADLPGVRVLLDGRNVTRADRWPGVTRLIIGKPDVNPE